VKQRAIVAIQVRVLLVHLLSTRIKNLMLLKRVSIGALKPNPHFIWRFRHSASNLRLGASEKCVSIDSYRRR